MHADCDPCFAGSCTLQAAIALFVPFMLCGMASMDGQFAMHAMMHAVIMLCCCPIQDAFDLGEVLQMHFSVYIPAPQAARLSAHSSPNKQIGPTTSVPVCAASRFPCKCQLVVYLQFLSALLASWFDNILMQLPI